MIRMKAKDLPKKLRDRIKAIDGVKPAKRAAKPKPALRGDCRYVNRVSLPLPPSVNHYYTVANGRKILSKAGRAYHDVVALACKEQNVGHNVGRLRVYISVNSQRFDLDNTLKAILDSLQKAGLYDNDGQIDRLVLDRVTEYGPVHVEVITCE